MTEKNIKKVCFYVSVFVASYIFMACLVFLMVGTNISFNEKIMHFLKENPKVLLFCFPVPGFLLLAILVTSLAWSKSGKEAYDNLCKMENLKYNKFIIGGTLFSLTMYVLFFLVILLSGIVSSLLPFNKILVFLIALAVLSVLVGDLAAPIYFKLIYKIAKRNR